MTVPKVEYWTDGSAWQGKVGFAVVKDLKPYLIGTENRKSTNIRAEGIAIGAALEDAEGAPCIIYTDSEFWVNMLTKWIPSWTPERRAKAKNADLVAWLYEVHQNSKATLQWVKGHASNKGNNIADEWAGNARICLAMGQRSVEIPDYIMQMIYEEE